MKGPKNIVLSAPRSPRKARNLAERVKGLGGLFRLVLQAVKVDKRTAKRCFVSKLKVCKGWK